MQRSMLVSGTAVLAVLAAALGTTEEMAARLVSAYRELQKESTGPQVPCIVMRTDNRNTCDTLEWHWHIANLVLCMCDRRDLERKKGSTYIACTPVARSHCPATDIPVYVSRELLVQMERTEAGVGKKTTEFASAPDWYEHWFVLGEDEVGILFSLLGSYFRMLESKETRFLLGHMEMYFEKINAVQREILNAIENSKEDD